jgi:hypothetical protein
MGHEVFGDRFLGRREPAWHALGQVFAEDEQLTVSQAFERAKILYQYVKFPLVAQTPHFGEEDYDELLVEEQVALYREPTEDDLRYALMGIVDKDYGVVQPSELAAALDPLCGRWPVETVGALRGGAIVFATLKQPSYDVKREQIDSYFLLSNGQGVDQSLRIAVTDVRVVCMNTLNAALDRTKLSVSVSHHKGVHEDMARYVELMANAEVAAEKQRDYFRLLADAPMTSAQAMLVMAAAFPEPKRPTRLQVLDSALKRAGYLDLKASELLAEEERQFELARERQAQFRLAGQAIYERLGDTSMIGGTAWGAYNAAVEVSDNRKGQNAVSAAAATLFGDRAQERARAFRKSVEIAGLAGVN